VWTSKEQWLAISVQFEQSGSPTRFAQRSGLKYSTCATPYEFV
jgi:hypothetical protein